LGRKVARERISAVLITENEERNIGRALASVEWADEIVVLDSGSSDSTVEIARGAGARVVTAAWQGYVAAKNSAAALAGGEWILSIDADEEVTPELRDEIESVVERPSGPAGYRVPRRNFYWGRRIRHCGWYPDYQLRLWRRGKGRWVGGRVHERVEVDGVIGRTKAPLNHYTYSSISEHIRRMDRYAGLSAMDRFEAGKRTGFLRLLFAAPWQFCRLYFFRWGFLDGIPGLIVSALGAHYAFLKHAKLWELQQKADVEER
jgi:(heptosyl)LPS beta-1,4-glucosyltransferase